MFDLQVLAESGVMFSPSNKQIYFFVKDPEKWKIIPDSKQAYSEQYKRWVVSIPMSEDVMKLVRNMGVNTTGAEPIRHLYDHPQVKGQWDLMPHQITTAAFLVDNPRSFCLSTMRTGKTGASIFAASYLQDTGKTRAWLVVSTLSTLRGVWEDEILGMYPNKNVVVVHASDGLPARRKLLATPADFYIINYDGMKLLSSELRERIVDGSIGGIIYDECTHLSNDKTALWKACDYITNGIRKGSGDDLISVPYVWGLTGTPGHPDKIYGQAKLIIPRNMTMTSGAWKRMTQYQVSSFKWCLRNDYMTFVERALTPSIRFDKKDIMDLPPVVEVDMEAPLSASQQKLYDTLRREMLASSEDGNVVKAVTASACVSKLIQIAAGAVITADGSVQTLDIGPKFKVLMDIVESTDRKVVIFCSHTGAIDLLMSKFSAHKIVADYVDGRVTGKRREEIFNKFKKQDSDIKVIICHPKTTAFGVELSQADTMIFYSPPLAGDFVYQQAKERLSSLLQTSEQISIVHLYSTPEEKKLYAGIRNGVSINETINDIFTGITKNRLHK